MKAVTSTLRKRITNFSLALLLSVTTITAVLPFTFADSASASPGIVYGSTGLGSLTFGPDRRAPSGGWSVAGNQLNMSIDNMNASADPGFYRTEGVQAALPTASTSLRAALFVDSTWEGKPIRAGLWGVAHSSTAADLAYPIIEFTTIGDGDFTGWRVFDTINGGWTNLPGAWYDVDSFNTVEVTYNAATKEYDYYVNDVFTISLPAAWETDAYGSIESVIFNSFNSATGDSADNYSVAWNSFETGVAPTTAECSTTTSLVTTDLATWDTSKTRVNGHNEITADGLRIYTDTDVTGSPDPRKAAGYYATDYALSDNGDLTIAESMDYASSGASAPGLQLIVDLDNDQSTDTVNINGMTGDGILVGEAIYGTDDWWLAEGNSVAQTGAKSGITRREAIVSTGW